MQVRSRVFIIYRLVGTGIFFFQPNDAGLFWIFADDGSIKFSNAIHILFQVARWYKTESETGHFFLIIQVPTYQRYSGRQGDLVEAGLPEIGFSPWGDFYLWDTGCLFNRLGVPR